LQKLHDEAPAGHVTLDWLMGNLHKQSFGLIDVLALVAAASGIFVEVRRIATQPGRRWNPACGSCPNRHEGVSRCSAFI
jgi:hypothetical protein